MRLYSTKKQPTTKVTKKGVTQREQVFYRKAVESKHVRLGPSGTRDE